MPATARPPRSTVGSTVSTAMARMLAVDRQAKMPAEASTIRMASVHLITDVHRLA